MNIIKSLFKARWFIVFNISFSLLIYMTFGSGFSSQLESFEKPSSISNKKAYGQIAYLTAIALQEIQYAHKKLDSNLSSILFDRYFNYWDPQHRFFLQSDLEEFAPYRTLLDDMILNVSEPDLKIAFEIFNRFKQRLAQNVTYVDELLEKEKFVFTLEESTQTERKDEPFPVDLKAAKTLWKNQLKAEYLDEKLAAKKEHQTKDKSEVEDIGAKLSKRYHRSLNIFSKYTDEEVIGAYLSVLSRLYDPHTDYLTESELESFDISMNLSLVGIGLELRTEDGFATVTRVLPGGPASKSKLKEGDKIVAVYTTNGAKIDLVDMRLDSVVKYIRGEKGTKVKIEVVPGATKSGSQYELTLVRDEIKLEDQEAKGQIINFPGSNKNYTLGIIDLPSFYSSSTSFSDRKNPNIKSSTSDVKKLLAKFQKEKVNGVILDLRRNGGGSLEEAISLTGLFIKEGPVVQIRDPKGKIAVENDEDPTIQYDGPLIVLTSRLSASASEILAGALQDYGRALIVGDSSTFGKGTVQGLFTLKNLYSKFPIEALGKTGGAVKLTVSKFYRPSGASTQNKGVIPDIILPSVLGVSTEIGENMLDESLPWDTINTDSFQKMNMVGPYLPELKKRSSVRLKKDPEFGYIRQDIERFKALNAQKQLSLNESNRLKEQKEEEAILERRKLERANRAPAVEVVHNITVKQTSMPGLPPAEDKTHVANSSTASSALNEEEEDNKGLDPTLKETQQILLDYISLSQRASTKGLTQTW